jgi:hypothetical protein
MQVIGYSPLDATGEATFFNIPAGKYALVAFVPDKRYSVVRTVSSGVETSGHVLTLAPGSFLSVTVFLAVGMVTVEGFRKAGRQTVLWSNGRPDPQRSPVASRYVPKRSERLRRQLRSARRDTRQLHLDRDRGRLGLSVAAARCAKSLPPAWPKPHHR